MSGASITPEIHSIPFDHYQRYGAAVEVLRALGLEAGRILEVGANRQRLLGAFLPQARLLYTDIRLEGGEQDFVIADASALPFAKDSFDAVVSLDVLEHIPSELRIPAVSEMARVAGKAVIIGCPTDDDWAIQADVDANVRWRELFGDDYKWLKEHEEFGLVDGREVVSTLQKQGLETVSLAHGDATLWASLMGTHFIKVKYPELEGLSQAADRLYNTRVFGGDHSDRPYRRYFVGLRNRSDAAKLTQTQPLGGRADDEARQLLERLADGLRAMALRTLSAESEWASTVGLLKLSAKDVEVAKREWKATSERLELSERNAAKVVSEWRLTAEAHTKLEADIALATREWKRTVDLLNRAERDALQATEGWKCAVEACTQKDRDLAVATREWRTTVERLEQAEATAAEAEVGWKSTVELCAQKDAEFAAATNQHVAALAKLKRRFAWYGVVAVILAFAAGALVMHAFAP